MWAIRMSQIVNLPSKRTLPMSVGTIFTYLGFVLTHCQQIFKTKDDIDQFINIKCYNSKCLVENMMSPQVTIMVDVAKKIILLGKP